MKGLRFLLAAESEKKIAYDYFDKMGIEAVWAEPEVQKISPASPRMFVIFYMGTAADEMKLIEMLNGKKLL